MLSKWSTYWKQEVQELYDKNNIEYYVTSNKWEEFGFTAASVFIVPALKPINNPYII